MARSSPSRPDELRRRGPRLRRRPVCRGACRRARRSATKRSSRSRSRWRGLPASRPTISSRQPSRPAQPLPARAAARPPPDHRPDQFALSSAPKPTPPAKAAELRSAGERDHGRLHRRDQRLSVPRSRLQDAAHLPAEQLCRNRQRLELPAQVARRRSSSPTPAPTLPRRCAKNPRLKILDRRRALRPGDAVLRRRI